MPIAVERGGGSRHRILGERQRPARRERGELIHGQVVDHLVVGHRRDADECRVAAAWKVVEQACRRANRFLVIAAHVPGHADTGSPEQIVVVVVAAVVVAAVRLNAVRQQPGVGHHRAGQLERQEHAGVRRIDRRLIGIRTRDIARRAIRADRPVEAHGLRRIVELGIERRRHLVRLVPGREMRDAHPVIERQARLHTPAVLRIRVDLRMTDVPRNPVGLFRGTWVITPSSMLA